MKMKHKLFFVLLFFSINAKSQSKQDTEIWIKATIENFYDRKSYKLLNVYFMDESSKNISIFEIVGSTVDYSEMPIKSINQIVFKETSNGYVLQLICSFNNACCETGVYEANAAGYTNKVPNSGPNKRGVTIQMSASIKNDNLIPRLKKALTHLIKLNGGKVISDTF